MTHILENGSGVAGAQAYIEPTFVTAYLADRNRTAENGWATVGNEGSEEDAATIAAADYVEQKYSETLLGSKEFRDISLARATLVFDANPTAGDTVTIGTTGGDGTGDYTFVATLIVAGDVLIGATTAESIANLIGAINLDVNISGDGFEDTTAENEGASASAFYGDSLVAFAKTVGTGGNAVVTTETLTADASVWNFATLVGGTDFVIPQPLLFPRRNLFDRDGIAVLGIPQKLEYACAEYSVRARAAALVSDPDVDSLGGNVTLLREKVGPIETTTQYQPGTANSGTLPSYPAADRFLREYIMRGGVVIR